MKKLSLTLAVLTLFYGLAFAAGQLSSVTVQNDGTIFIKTGSPAEFKSFWTGSAGSFKLIMDLPGVAVDKSATLTGGSNLSRSKDGLKGVRFSQFKSEPPVARVVVEMTDKFSYTWNTVSDGIKIRFRIPSTTATAHAPIPSGGIKIGSPLDGAKSAAPTTSAPQPAGPAAAPAPATPVPSVSTASKPGTTSKQPLTTTGGTTAPKPAASDVSQKPGTSGPATSTGVKTLPSGLAPAPKAATIVGDSQMTAVPSTLGKPATASSQPKAASDSNLKATSSVSTPVVSSTGKTGTPSPSKSVTQPPSGSGQLPSQVSGSAAAGGATGGAVKPSTSSGTTTTTVGPVGGTTSKPAAAQPTSTSGSTVAPPSSKATPPATTTTGTGTKSSPASPAAQSASVSGGPSKDAAGKATGGASKTAVPATKTAPLPAGTAKADTGKSKIGESTETVDPEKFKQDLKKALGKIEPAAKPEDNKQPVGAVKEVLPVTKPGEGDFQEQLKRALDPAKSLTDSGEVADLDDIDTDLPAEDDESESFDTSLAPIGGTFMQVSPSRKVIRYHSEGRRDPFLPLVGKSGYASKKRRAVPSAEQLRLVGLMRSLAGNKAVFEDGEGNGYILAPGDRVRNGYLVSVAENKVLFQVNEYGWTKTVAMELVSTE